MIFQLSQKRVYSVMKDSAKIVVIMVILWSEICLSGKIVILVLGESVKIPSQWKTEKECLCNQEVDAVCDFNLQGIFVLIQAIILSELTHNLMVWCCFWKVTWLVFWKSLSNLRGNSSSSI